MDERINDRLFKGFAFDQPHAMSNRVTENDICFNFDLPTTQDPFKTLSVKHQLIIRLRFLFDNLGLMLSMVRSDFTECSYEKAISHKVHDFQPNMPEPTNCFITKTYLML